MTPETYSPAPAPEPERERSSRTPVAAAVLVTVLAVGLGSYRLGKRAGLAQVPSPAPAAAPAVPVPAAPAPDATREFIQVDLGPAETPPLAPLGKTLNEAADDVVIFKRSIVRVGRHKKPAVSGRAIDLQVDGKPYRVYLQVFPADPYTEEAIIFVKGRKKPHVVDWGGSETRWDGQSMTWSPKK